MYQSFNQSINQYIHTYRHTYIHTYRQTYIHYITLHYIALHYITLHYHTLHYITIHYHTLPYITIHYHTLHYITLPYITIHYITLPYITLHYHTLHTLPYITLHYITLPYITIHYITLPYITLHYHTLPYIALHCKLNAMVQTVQSKFVAMTEQTKQGKAQKPKKSGRPANPPARFAFRLTKNGETTRERGQGPTKTTTQKLPRDRGNHPSMPLRNACTVTKTNSKLPQWVSGERTAVRQNNKLVQLWNRLYIRKFILSESSHVCFS